MPVIVLDLRAQSQAVEAAGCFAALLDLRDQARDGAPASPGAEASGEEGGQIELDLAILTSSGRSGVAAALEVLALPATALESSERSNRQHGVQPRGSIAPFVTTKVAARDLEKWFETWDGAIAAADSTVDSA